MPVSGNRLSNGRVCQFHHGAFSSQWPWGESNPHVQIGPPALNRRRLPIPSQGQMASGGSNPHARFRTTGFEPATSTKFPSRGPFLSCPMAPEGVEPSSRKAAGFKPAASASSATEPMGESVRCREQASDARRLISRSCSKPPKRKAPVALSGHRGWRFSGYQRAV